MFLLVLFIQFVQFRSIQACPVESITQRQSIQSLQLRVINRSWCINQRKSILRIWILVTAIKYIDWHSLSWILISKPWNRILSILTQCMSGWLYSKGCDIERGPSSERVLWGWVYCDNRRNVSWRSKLVAEVISLVLTKHVKMLMNAMSSNFMTSAINLIC